MSNETDASPDPELQRREERRETARHLLASALAEFIEAATEHAHYVGFREGVEYGQEKLREFLKKPSPARNALAHNHASFFKSLCENIVDFGGNAGQPEKTAADIVRAALHSYPGLTGAQLYEKIRETGVQLNERTFRTALWRMKVPATEMPGPGHIIGIDNGWYLFEDAPPDAIENIRESRRQLHAMATNPNRHGGRL